MSGIAINTKNQNSPIQKKPLSTQSQNDNKPSDDKGLSNAAKLAIGATALASLVVGGLLLHRHCNVNQTKQILQKNKEFEEIFNNVKINFRASNKSRDVENLSVNQIFSKYLQTYDATGKTFYHGTGKEVAEKMQKTGMKKGSLGSLTTNWNGSYFAEDISVAKSYADKVAQRGRTNSGIRVSAPTVVEANLPDSTKLAQFENKDGDVIHDVLCRIFEDQNLSQTLDSKKLSQFDFVDFLQAKLVEKGYSGVRSYDSHTGFTPTIFDDSLIRISKVID